MYSLAALTFFRLPWTLTTAHGRHTHNPRSHLTVGFRHTLLEFPALPRRLIPDVTLYSVWSTSSVELILMNSHTKGRQ